MEQTLHQAAIEGNVTLLHQILKKDPLVLYRLNSGWFGWSPLHVAALRGHANFVTEILNLNPDLAEVPDSSQRLPLHLASAKGHVNVVEALISVDPKGQGRCVESVSSSQFASS
ncbi:Ankyrin repeat-containing protein ITN1 [Camellia lanceoleosa]|uniref:Ankyrin repeat-containing protein ITN1 n=1 Tax=Camellia lanceoleosa TaxID=1840588 RepID=A0ACC0G2W6_9ERIC|nr:Ankyrin repeat-containing protein ITN1 [Camellia lanceoleosa]